MQSEIEDTRLWTGGLIGKPDEIDNEALLWRAVLGQAVRDICDKNERVKREVLMWMKTTDFDTICDLANVHADSMSEQLYALADLAPSLAKKYGQILRSKIVEDIY